MNDAANPSAEAGATFQSTGVPRPPLTKVVVAIHGIGSQTRSSTVRSVAVRFGARATPAVAVMPLGYFHIEETGEVRVSRLDVPTDDPLSSIGFAEVFWADIPRRVAEEEDTLEETKAWGATVVSRAHAAYQRNVADGKLTPEDFRLVEGAVDEVLETVHVMENLCALASAGGILNFDLGKLLRDYLGDVQIVAEFRYFREQIVLRFHTAMAQIVSRYKQEYGTAPELYVVAHSEGTVVSFLALLQALSGSVPGSDTPDSPEWIRYVKGYMTLGSPIDKHLVLWPGMWQGLELRSRVHADGRVVFAHNGTTRLELPQRIRWRNYYDHGDPIGFQLDTAERWLSEHGCEAFEFSTRKHDHGFSRYLLPGKAHNDYWDDAEVFGHFIEDVVLPTGTPEPPADRRFCAFVSSAIPYAISVGCQALGLFLLFKAITAYSKFYLTAWETTKELTALTLLFAGITVAARLPRLLKPAPSIYLWSALAFALGALAYAFLPPDGAHERLGQIFKLVGVDSDSGYTAGIITLATLTVIAAWLAPRRPRLGHKVLVMSGALAVALTVLGRLADVSGEGEPVWPVLLAGAMFLYLWWLGILLFDLAFIWHRYIRHSIAIDNLWFWSQHVDAPTGHAVRQAQKAAAPAIGRVEAAAKKV